MIVSILNQKGGVGKTTISVHLARYFTKKGMNVILIDSDENQRSALEWHERSDGNLAHVVGQPALTLHNDVKKYINMGCEWIFIDGVPQVSNKTAAAIKCSDIILIPVQPSPYDLWASNQVVELIKTHQAMNFNKPYGAFVVSRKIANSNLGKDVHESLEGYDLPVFKSGTCQRVVYPHSVNIGSTVLDMGYDAKEAANEIEEIAKELEEIANVINSDKKA
jgi:chromosome partitioning protein